MKRKKPTRKNPNEHMSTAGIENLLSPDQMCGILGIKKSTLYYWTSKEMIPYIKIWGLLRFRESDIKKWLKLKEHCGIISNEAIDIINNIQ